MTPALRFAHVSKRFGALQALDDASFQIESGEVFGYLGPNGAGKTTSLRIILGLVHADSGDVAILGQPARRAASRRCVGFLPGDLALYPDLTCAEALDHFAGYRPERPPVLRRALLDAFGVTPDVLARRIKFLSHGTRQKIGLVVAMQHDPDLLLLDEPSTGLDPLVQQAFREAVLDFARRGRAVLFSSHVLSEVEQVCGRVAILRAGRIVAVDAVSELRGRTVRRLRVRFRGAWPDGLETTPGVVAAERVGEEWQLSVRGDVNPLLRRLALRDVASLVFPEPELEDVFLAYYREGGEERP
ncbi:MAG TPA: ABC transporter ATP-binding protein [Longimicrobiales bacterium]